MRRIFNFVFLLYFIIIIFIKSNYVSFIPKALDPNILIAIMGAIMLFNPYYSYGKLMSRKYGIMGLIVILSLIHLLLFNPFETDAWVYLIARLITFSAIIFFIELNEERVTNKFLSNIIIAILIIFGLSIITSGFSTGSLTLGFKNQNNTGSFLILMLAYSYFNFFNPGFISKRIKGYFEIILAIAVVLTGSRSALLMLVIMIFYFLWFEKRYSVFKKLILGISILLFPLFLNSLFTADYTTGIDRFESGATVYRKNIEIKAAKATIRNSPLKGYGIQKYGWSDENAAANNARIHYVGRKDFVGVIETFAISDVAVVPSEFEPWGLVVNEAMAAGLPVIASDRVGCIDDLVKGGETGLVFPSGDVEALTRVMKQVAESDTLRVQMGKAGQQFISGWRLQDEAGILVSAWQCMVNE